MSTLAVDQRRTHHWIAVNSYRVRIAAFAVAAVPVGLHLMPTMPGGWFWIAFLAQFFAYPQVVQALVRRMADPELGEYRALVVDALAFGGWAAGLGFPLWITVTLFLATLLNHAVTFGFRGVITCTLALLAGALASTTVIAFHVSTDTNGLVTLASIVGLAIYTSLMGVEFFTYVRRLHDVQEAVARQRQTLEDANLALKEQIGQIHALQDQLREQANRDSLTGLFNRRYLEGTLERELSRCRREGVPLSMLLLDLDHFKLVNDTYGHQAGDAVLRAVARRLLESARAEDIVCRYGGEEFLLVLPKMPLGIAHERAKRLLNVFRSTPVVFGEQTIHLTTSIGIATVPDHADSVESLVRAADQALYRAKSSGRNRVVDYGEA